LEAIQHINSDLAWNKFFSKLADKLPEELWPQLLGKIQHIDFTFGRPEVFSALADKLPKGL
jgi:hypothetical protein